MERRRTFRHWIKSLRTWRKDTRNISKQRFCDQQIESIQHHPSNTSVSRTLPQPQNEEGVPPKYSAVRKTGGTIHDKFMHLLNTPGLVSFRFCTREPVVVIRHSADATVSLCLDYVFANCHVSFRCFVNVQVFVRSEAGHSGYRMLHVQTPKQVAGQHLHRKDWCEQTGCLKKCNRMRVLVNREWQPPRIKKGFQSVKSEQV